MERCDLGRRLQRCSPRRCVWHRMQQRRARVAQRVPRLAVVLRVGQEGIEAQRDLIARAGLTDSGMGKLTAHGKGEPHEVPTAWAPPVLVRCPSLAQLRSVRSWQAAKMVDSWADIAAGELSSLAANEALVVLRFIEDG